MVFAVKSAWWWLRNLFPNFGTLKDGAIDSSNPTPISLAIRFQARPVARNTKVRSSGTQSARSECRGTGRRVYRHRPESEWVVTSAPHLRIVSDELFTAVERRFEITKKLKAGEYSKTQVPTEGRPHHSRTSEIVIQFETPSLTNVFDPCLPMWTGFALPSIVLPEVGRTFRCDPPTTSATTTS